MPVDDMCKSIAEFLGTRCEVALKADTPLTDIPHGYVDCDLISGPALGRLGRSNVNEFLGHDAVTIVKRTIEGEEQVFCVMRQSLRFYHDDRWMIRDTCHVSRDVAEAAVSAALAQTAADAAEHVVALGAKLPLHSDMKLTSRTFRKYAVVGMGRWCSKHWKQGGSLPVTRSAHK